MSTGIKTKLDFLFDKYNISEKNRYDIHNIYIFLDDQKKAELLNNFESFSEKILKIESDVQIEKALLIDSSVEKIKKQILKNREQK